MRIGSLFSGAGGLDLAVEAVFGGEVVWHAEIDKAASKVLAHRFSGVPNMGSVTDIDWATVPPVDVLCGGFPCQDVSAAGKRAGIKAGTRSGLWSVFAEAIDVLRPQYVVIENVRGLLSAAAHRNGEEDGRDPLEPNETGLGNGAGGPVLRAAGAVLGDLADLGYDAQWTTVAVRAPGDATPDARGDGCGRCAARGRSTTPDAVRSAVGQQPGGTPGPQAGAYPGDRSGDHRRERADVELLPTPNAQDGNGVRNLNETAVHELLSTPQSRDYKGQPSDGFNNANLCRDVADVSAWGKYAPAIHRWESLTRPAPAPTEPNKNGNPRLSASFSEWLMGWPDGWVTDPAIGISRNDQLRIVGNGVCPQQAAAALRWLLAVAAGSPLPAAQPVQDDPRLPTPCSRDWKDGEYQATHTPSLGAVSAYFDVEGA